MKNTFLKIDKPCTEKWENMTANADGSFCDVCAKNVIDFTKINPLELAQKIKEAGKKGNICGRITQSQMNEPLFELNTRREFNLPYSNIAAGIMVAASFTMASPVIAQGEITKTEIIDENRLMAKEDTIKPDLAKNTDLNLPSNLIEKTVFKGKVVTQDNVPIENAEIIFVTIEKLIRVYSAKDGTFSMEIPNELIDGDNVVRVISSIDKNEKNVIDLNEFGTKDYIFSENDINIEQLIVSYEIKYFITGAMISYEKEEKYVIHPLTIYQGKEITNKEFNQMINRKRNLKKFESFYFQPYVATAISGENANDGLFLIFDKTDE